MSERLVDLRAEEADIDVHRIGLCPRSRSPIHSQQRLPADDPFLVLQQIFQQVKLPRVSSTAVPFTVTSWRSASMTRGPA